MMRVDTPPFTVFTIHDAPGLDPVTVVLQDIAPGRGRIIIECFGKSWSTYWNATGTQTIAEFVRTVSVDYMVSKLHDHNRRLTKAEERYLRRICEAVQQALSKLWHGGE